MENQVVNSKFTWVIKNFSSLESDRIYSDTFVVGGCKWRLMAYPKGRKNNNQFSLYLDVAESTSLPSGWRRHAEFSFIIINHNPEKLSKLRDMKKWFNAKDSDWGFSSMFCLTKLKAKNSGYLVNGELKIVADVNVLEVVGLLDVPKEASSVTESVDVNGFQVLPSQVETVRRVFDKQPGIALEFRAKNHHLRTACINVILSLMESLSKSLQEILFDDLVEAESAVTYLKYAGFKMDWFEKKLEEVKAKKKVEQICETRLKEFEEELKDIKQKESDIEAQLEKAKAKVLASGVCLTLDDFF